MIRLDDAQSEATDVESDISFVPQRLKFWYQMIPCAKRNPSFPFSTHWPPLLGEPDDLVATLGDVGCWQVIIVSLMLMFNIPTVFHVASPEVSIIHDYWCHRINQNLTIEQWRELSSVERINFRGETVVDPCYIKDLPYMSSPYEDLKYMAASGNIKCEHWDYNSSRVSIVSQFNLACTRLPVNNVAESVFSVGAAVGGLITSYLADRYGRKKLLMLSQGVVVVLGFLNANVSSYSSYIFLRTLLGAACSAVLICSILLCSYFSELGVEITGGKWRDILTTVYMFSYGFGYIILSWCNNLFDNWIHLQYSITLIAIFLLSIWWLVPESPRFLLTSQNLPRLMLMLEMASSFNRRALAPGTSTKMKNMAPMRVEYRPPTIGMLFKGKAMKRMTFISPFILFFTSLTYFGLVLNQDLFNYGLAVSGAVEIFAEFVVIMLGIKNDVKMLCITTALSGVCCLAAAGLTKSVYLDVACMGSRFFGGMMNACLTTTVATMYPTLVRTMFLGWSLMFSNIGLAVGANIVLLTAVSASLPLIILGMSGLLGAFFMLFIPGRVCRDLLDLPEELEYGHQVISQQQSLRPRPKLVQPRWSPTDELAREGSSEKSSPDQNTFTTKPARGTVASEKKDLRMHEEDLSAESVAVTGNVDPDDFRSKKTAMGGPIAKKKKNVKLDDSSDAKSSQLRTQPETFAPKPPPKKRRRWYLLFLC